MEITGRTIQGRYLLRPSVQLNEVVVGVIGRAQRKHQVEVCALTVLSNHIHLLVFAEDCGRLAEFMHFVDTNLSKKVGRLHDWSGTLWHGRYSAVPVSGEEAAQVARLKYVLAQGVKEHLVARMRDWPGVHCARALVDGERLRGFWFDGTREYYARRRGQPVDRCEFAEPEEIVLSPLPCWRHLSAEEYGERVAELAEQVEAEAAVERKAQGKAVLGVRATLARDPHHRPETLERRPRPRIHAASRAAREQFLAAYAEFVAAFRQASRRFRSGDRTAVFPPGSFPPAQPFVRALAARAP